MEIKVRDLSKEHPIVKAAHAMVEAHKNHDTLIPALEEVKELFPELDNSQIIALWCGINAKDQE